MEATRPRPSLAGDWFIAAALLAATLLVGVREVRAYQLAGTKFILVFEPFERHGAPRVAAIYLQ